MLKLQALELSKSYRGRKVVDDVELEIGQGEVVGLLGPNGAGKTTTFYILVGLARPDSGRVLLNGDEITALPMYLSSHFGLGDTWASWWFRRRSAERGRSPAGRERRDCITLWSCVFQWAPEAQHLLNYRSPVL